MSDTDNSELDEIRQQKREQLRETHGNETTDGESGETPDEPIQVSGMDDLERLVSQHRAVLVDCYADWCGPCKMMEPVIEDLAGSTDATIAKVDVDANQQVAAQLGAQSIPTFVLFVDGEPTERLVGAQDQATFEQLLAQA
jgi:Thioredoxin domain-containing protein